MKIRLHFVLGIMFLAAFSLLLSPCSSLHAADLRVTYMDVSDGDAILIETPAGKRILIDGGIPDAGNKVILPLLKARGITKLDGMILTHNHEDHHGGLSDIFLSSTVVVATFYHSEALASLAANIKDRLHTSTTKTQLTSGTWADFAETDLAFRVFHAKIDDAPIDGTAVNNNSLVIRMVYKNHTFLFTGDVEAKAIGFLLGQSSGNAITANFYKVPHHGSSTGHNTTLITKVNPTHVIIQGHTQVAFNLPAQSVVDFYKGQGISVLETQKEGSITLTSNGVTFTIQKDRPLSQDTQKEKPKVRCYPNPAPGLTSPEKTTILYTLAGRADSAVAKIFTLSGEFVRELAGSANAGDNFVDWDLKNSAGEPVANGLYLVVVDVGVGGFSRVGKARLLVRHDR